MEPEASTSLLARGRKYTARQKSNGMQHVASDNVRRLLRDWFLSHHSPGWMEERGIDLMSTRQLFQLLDTEDHEEADRLLKAMVHDLAASADRDDFAGIRERQRHHAARTYGFEYAPAPWLSDGLAVSDNTFETFKARMAAPSVWEARNLVMEWVKALHPKPLLLLRGAPGVGKTHLLQAAGIELRPAGIFYRTEAELLAEWQRGFQDKVLAEELEYATHHVAALLLDDLGVGLTSAWALALIDRLVDWRYDKGMRLMATTNLSSAALAALSPRLASRFLDRERSTVQVIDAPDYRPIGKRGKHG